MPGVALLPLATWQNFYVIVGTAAATLTGLMFVVITLIVQLRVQVSSPRSGIAVFSTPNVVHFGLALRFSAHPGRRSGLLVCCSALWVWEG